MKRKKRVLIVDDEKNFAELLGREIGRRGYETKAVHDAQSALRELEESDYDVALLDIRMPGKSGLELLSSIKESGLTTEVIMLTGHATVETALSAMRAGAYDYLTKPCKLEELELLLDKAVERRETLQQNRVYRRLLATPLGDTAPIGESELMRSIFGKLDKIAAATDVPVLLTGETGTGKELIAREIHRKSPLRDAPFVAVNCAVLQAQLLESELFGHEKGAFTGAVQRKIGLIEVADGGTLFLDEIGETAEDVQAKLLRFLQEGELRRLGGTDTLQVSVRVLAATNRDLEVEVGEGRFRKDLLYRLNVLPLHLPPLRQRPEDIEPLVTHFLDRLRGGRGPFEVEESAMDLLRKHPWLGNVREVENVVRRLIVFQEEPVISLSEVREALGLVPGGAGEPTGSLVLADVEKEHILRVLRLEGGNKTQTAKTLGIALKTLYNKLAAYKEEGAATDADPR